MCYVILLNHGLRQSFDKSYGADQSNGECSFSRCKKVWFHEHGEGESNENSSLDLALGGYPLALC